MIISFRKWIERGKFVVLFVLLTYVIFHLFSYISFWIEPAEKYKEPVGRAVKVFDHQERENVSMKERLRFFYWYGE